MHSLTDEEIVRLAESVGIEVPESQLETVRSYVNENLAGLGDVDEIDVETPLEPTGDRSWWTPSASENEHDGIVTRCDVPPTDSNDGTLSGVTVGAKDIIAVAGVPMECGSETMIGYVPGRDAIVIERLREAGATISAKTNLDEFAGGARSISHHGEMRNPYDRSRIPGGSSGGSAIAVATGQVDVALGTDTGGSVRMPSSHCGIVGLKQSYGLVPLTGVVENTYTIDHVGPMTSSVADAAAVLDAIAGKNRTDPASMRAAGRDEYAVGGYTDAVEAAPDISDVTIGVVPEGLGDGAAEDEVDSTVVEHTEGTIDRLVDAGATVKEVPIYAWEAAGPIKRTLSYTELAAHWRDRGAPIRRGGVVDEGYQADFAARTRANGSLAGDYYLARMIAGAFLLEEKKGRTYTRAHAARRALERDLREALEEVDALATPTVAGLAPTREEADDPGLSYSRNTRPANVTGLPAISIPSGTSAGLPIGFQLMAGAFDDAALLATAASVESVIATGAGEKA